MKKITKLLALLLAVSTIGSCGTPNDTQVGLITDAVTTDPDATRVTAPVASDTTDVNVRTDDGSVYEYPETPADDGSTRIKFLAAGDNIIHENVYIDARSRAKDGAEYNFIDMYDGIADMVAEADLAFINQETPICGDDEFAPSGYPYFNSPEAAGDTLVELGFDIVNVAHNHMLDKYEKGYRGTLDYWAEWADEVTMIGGYYNRADYENIRIVEEQGVKIAFLSYTYGTNDPSHSLPADSEMVIPYIDEDEIVSMTKKAKELADLVFVVMHWGEEYWFQISKEQATLATAITEAGADVIIGMHPHVIQPVEWKTASDGSQTLVIYSLGNLISTQYNNYNMIGGIMTFDIVKDKDGIITIENPLFNPTVTHYNKERLGLQVYLAEDYTAELCALHGTPNYGDDPTWTLPYIRSTVTKNIKAEFLSDFFNT